MRRLFISVLAICSCVSAGFAGDFFLQFRIAKSRCGVPCKYEYITNQNPDVAMVVSETFVAVGTGSTARRTFVFDSVKAGPLLMSSIRASTTDNGDLFLTGILSHSGGDSGQLLGGRAVVRIEAMTDVSADTLSGTSVAATEETYWIRRNVLKSVHLGVQYPQDYPGGICEVQRVRLFLEYHANR